MNEITSDELRDLGRTARDSFPHTQNYCEEINGRLADMLRDRLDSHSVEFVHGSVSGTEGTAEHFYVQLDADAVTDVHADSSVIIDATFNQFNDMDFRDDRVGTTFGVLADLDPIAIIPDSDSRYSAFH